MALLGAVLAVGNEGIESSAVDRALAQIDTMPFEVRTQNLEAISAEGCSRVTALAPPVVENILGGGEQHVLACLALFVPFEIRVSHSPRSHLSLQSVDLVGLFLRQSAVGADLLAAGWVDDEQLRQPLLRGRLDLAQAAFGAHPNRSISRLCRSRNPSPRSGRSQSAEARS